MSKDEEKIIHDTLIYAHDMEIREKKAAEAITLRAEELKKNYKQHLAAINLEEEAVHQAKMKQIREIANQSDEEKLLSLKKLLKDDS